MCLLLSSSCSLRLFQDKVPQPIEKTNNHIEAEKEATYYLANNIQSPLEAKEIAGEETFELLVSQQEINQFKMNNNVSYRRLPYGISLNDWSIEHLWYNIEYEEKWNDGKMDRIYQVRELSGRKLDILALIPKVVF